jgi:hypothetical protein
LRYLEPSVGVLIGATISRCYRFYSPLLHQPAIEHRTQRLAKLPKREKAIDGLVVV